VRHYALGIFQGLIHQAAFLRHEWPGFLAMGADYEPFVLTRFAMALRALQHTFRSDGTQVRSMLGFTLRRSTGFEFGVHPGWLEGDLPFGTATEGITFAVELKVASLDTMSTSTSHAELEQAVTRAVEAHGDFLIDRIRSANGGRSPRDGGLAVLCLHLPIRSEIDQSVRWDTLVQRAVLASSNAASGWAARVEVGAIEPAVIGLPTSGLGLSRDKARWKVRHDDLIILLGCNVEGDQSGGGQVALVG
jgi:hypothetical protein